MKISGTTGLIAHIGYPTESFKAPLVYNPYFAANGIDAMVVPMGCTAADYEDFLPLVARLSNFLGALITMPHKVTTVGLLDEATATVAISGSCNAVKRDTKGRLIGDMFDGEGFVRSVRRKGRRLEGASLRIVGCGGAGSAIAASMAKAGVARIGLGDTRTPTRDGLCARLQEHYPAVTLVTDPDEVSGWDIIVNATPLGMAPHDPLPLKLDGVAPSTLVGDVVMTQEITPFLAAACAEGCDVQIGLDMLFEQIPAYLEFFGLPPTTPEELRAVSGL